MKVKNVGKHICFIGQNSRENWDLLDQAKNTDYFFHLSSFPSCYVILKTNGENIERVVLEKCAKICLENTKFRGATNIYVDFTLISNVEKGEEIGEIYYKSNRKVERIKLSS